MFKDKIVLFDKIKQFLFELYPELGRFKLFSVIKENFVPKINPYLKLFIRYGLPIAILTTVLVLGLSLGSFLDQLRQPDLIIPPSLDSTVPAPSSSFQSEFTTIRQSLNSFTIQLPDPVPPVVDYKISLQEIEDDYRLEQQ